MLLAGQFGFLKLYNSHKKNFYICMIKLFYIYLQNINDDFKKVISKKIVKGLMKNR